MQKTRFLEKILLSMVFSLGFIPATLAESTLISQATGINYAPLRQLLQNKKWREANEKTYTLFLKATDRELQGWIAPEQFKEFPCDDLRIIDQLWREASGNHFGFTVQFPIYIAAGNRPGRLTSIEAYETFGDRLGWRKGQEWVIFKENLNYTIDAPLGHLPAPRREYIITGGRLDYSNLAARMVSCKMVAGE
jgi:hypothetical protein